MVLNEKTHNAVGFVDAIENTQRNEIKKNCLILCDCIHINMVVVLLQLNLYMNFDFLSCCTYFIFTFAIIEIFAHKKIKPFTVECLVASKK